MKNLLEAQQGVDLWQRGRCRWKPGGEGCERESVNTGCVLERKETAQELMGPGRNKVCGPEH